MSYRIAGIDVHKKMLAIVVADVEVEGEHQFERRLFPSSPEHLRSLAEWLIERESRKQSWNQRRRVENHAVANKALMKACHRPHFKCRYPLR